MKEKLERENFKKMMPLFSKDITKLLTKYQKKYNLDINESFSCLTYIYLDMFAYLINDIEIFESTLQELIKDYLKKASKL